VRGASNSATSIVRPPPLLVALTLHGPSKGILSLLNAASEQIGKLLRPRKRSNTETKARSTVDALATNLVTLAGRFTHYFMKVFGDMFRLGVAY
jgi:hypothetical protein